MRSYPLHRWLKIKLASQLMVAVSTRSSQHQKGADLTILSALQIRILSLTFGIPRVLPFGVIVALMPTPVFGQTAPAKPPVAPFSIGIELMTDSEGVDLTPFMKNLFKSVRDRAVATMPKSVALGDQGRVTISFHVQKDGSLVTALVTASPAVPRVLYSSGKKTLDDHAMAAIRSAAPFDHLPDSLSDQSVELKLTFFYNLSPPSR